MLREEKGMALILVITIMLALLLLGGAMTTYAVVEVKHAARQDNKMQAFYLARGAADALAFYLLNHESRVQKADELVVAGLTDQISLKDSEGQPLNYGQGTVAIQVMAKHPDRPNAPDDDFYYIVSTGTVRGVSDRVVIRLLLVTTLPTDPSDAFPGEYVEEDWKNAAGEDINWTTTPGHNTLRIKDSGESDEPIYFPNGLMVEHQENQIELSIYTPYMDFRNEGTSLDIKQGNTLVLHSDILVFRGKVELHKVGGNEGQQNFGILKLNVYNPQNGVDFTGNGYYKFEDFDDYYGKVYFYNDVYSYRNQNNQEIIIERGLYYFRHGATITGWPRVNLGIYGSAKHPVPTGYPPDLIPIGAGGSSGSADNKIWQ